MHKVAQRVVDWPALQRAGVSKEGEPALAEMNLLDLTVKFDLQVKTSSGR